MGSIIIRLQQTAAPCSHQDQELQATLAKTLGSLQANQTPTIFLDYGRILLQADSARTLEYKSSITKWNKFFLYTRKELNTHKSQPTPDTNYRHLSGRAPVYTNAIHMSLINHEREIQKYLLIVYINPMFNHFFSIIRPSNKLWHAMLWGKKRSHANCRTPIRALHINGGHIEIPPTLTTGSSTKAFLKQHIFAELQIEHQVNICHPFQYFLWHITYT